MRGWKKEREKRKEGEKERNRYNDTYSGIRMLLNNITKLYKKFIQILKTTPEKTDINAHAWMKNGTYDNANVKVSKPSLVSCAHIPPDQTTVELTPGLQRCQHLFQTEKKNDQKC